jgi:hypothetical protein
MIHRPGRSPTEVDARLGAAAGPLRMLTSLTQYNSDVKRLDEDLSTLTYYHSTSEPSITPAAYAERLSRYGDAGAEGILIALRLIGRCHHVSSITLTRLSVHRLLISGITLAGKLLMDRFHKNALLAKVGALTVRELNGLEKAFFRDIDHRAFVVQEELDYLVDMSTRANIAFADGDVDAGVNLALRALCSEAPSTIARVSAMPAIARAQSDLGDSGCSRYGDLETTQSTIVVNGSFGSFCMPIGQRTPGLPGQSPRSARSLSPSSASPSPGSRESIVAGWGGNVIRHLRLSTSGIGATPSASEGGVEFEARARTDGTAPPSPT